MLPYQRATLTIYPMKKDSFPLHLASYFPLPCFIFLCFTYHLTYISFFSPLTRMEAPWEQGPFLFFSHCCFYIPWNSAWHVVELMDIWCNNNIIIITYLLKGNYVPFNTYWRETMYQASIVLSTLQMLLHLILTTIQCGG